MCTLLHLVVDNNHYIPQISGHVQYKTFFFFKEKKNHTQIILPLFLFTLYHIYILYSSDIYIYLQVAVLPVEETF